MDQSHTSSDVRLRPAGPADIHRLVPLLPRGFASPAHSRYLLAECPASGELLGGAYVTLGPGAQGGRTAVFDLTVPDESRLAEVAPLLLRGCIVQARAAGATALGPEGLISEGDRLEELVRAHGFAPVQTLTEYVMDTHKMLEACHSACRRVKSEGGPPAGGRVLPLSEAPRVPVQELIRRHLGASPDLDWQGPGARVSGHLSTVAQIGHRVVGAIVIEEINGEALAPYDVVVEEEEEFRKGWVPIVLWRESVTKGIESGYDEVRFRTNEEQFRAFADFAERMESTPVGQQTRYSLALGS